MKTKELRAKTISELQELILQHSKEYFNLKMQKMSGQLSKPNQFRTIRRDIARIHTLIGEREKADE